MYFAFLTGQLTFPGDTNESERKEKREKRNNNNTAAKKRKKIMHRDNDEIRTHAGGAHWISSPTP